VVHPREQLRLAQVERQRAPGERRALHLRPRAGVHLGVAHLHRAHGLEKVESAGLHHLAHVQLLRRGREQGAQADPADVGVAVGRHGSRLLTALQWGAAAAGGRRGGTGKAAICGRQEGYVGLGA
jgi:hypothetical protein